MTLGTTKPTPAEVAFGVAVELVAEPVLETTVEVCSIEVLTDGEPVATRMLDSDRAKVDAVTVELPTTRGTMGALAGTSVVDGAGAMVLEAGVTLVGEPTGVAVEGSSETLTVTERPTGTTGVAGTTTGAVDSVGGQ